MQIAALAQKGTQPLRADTQSNGHTLSIGISPNQLDSFAKPKDLQAISLESLAAMAASSSSAQALTPLQNGDAMTDQVTTDLVALSQERTASVFQRSPLQGTHPLQQISLSPTKANLQEQIMFLENKMRDMISEANLYATGVRSSAQEQMEAQTQKFEVLAKSYEEATRQKSIQ